ncbi:uncharacterized protein LOC114326227 [Diabrotica virgifera virgifera]|uniref:Uncharacterized protein LOC114326227 n=1 Tax=Diabrotica virgifera virgifera TaxID=50390 RepID=A0A6P7F9P5_DIAVI|nr:uncharacterized protein LOC114326227 [Diabrotica virgifera virgifera]
MHSTGLRSLLLISVLAIVVITAKRRPDYCFCDEGCYCAKSCVEGFVIRSEKFDLCPKDVFCCVNLHYPLPKYLDLDPVQLIDYKNNVVLVAKDVEKELNEKLSKFQEYHLLP